MTMWLIWASAVTALLAAAAWLAEQLLRSAGKPTRWVWVGAIGAALALQAWSWLAPVEAAPPVQSLAVTTGATSIGGGQQATGSVLAAAGAWLGSFDGPMRLMWIGGSALLFLALATGLARLGWRRRSWTRASVAGEKVLLSTDFGPALVGVIRPWIVLPRWALGLEPERLRLTFLHEAEHRRARDTALLLGATFALVATPLNPALWWGVRRLRQAIELDCDRRVLARGVSADAYGTLLIDLSAAARPFRLPIAALSNRPSLLERRLKTMTMKNDRVSPIRLAGTLAAVGALTLAACEAPTPAAPGESEAANAIVATQEGGSSSIAAADPLVYVDGVRVTGDRSALLDGLDPATIERMEVIKGEAAELQYGPDAANGVVLITLKPQANGEAAGELRFGPEGGATGMLRRRAPAGVTDEPTRGGEFRFSRPESDEGLPSTIYIDGELAESFADIGGRVVARAEVTGTGPDRVLRITTKPR